MKKLLVIAVLCPLLSGCGFLRSTVPVLDLLRDTAKTRCATVAAVQHGLSLQEAFAEYCELEEQWGPFLDLILAEQAEQAQMDAAAMGKTLPPGASRVELQLQPEPETE